MDERLDTIPTTVYNHAGVIEEQVTDAPEAVATAPRILAYNQLDALDMIRITDNLKMKSNYEGYTLDHFSDCLFMFYKNVFVILAVDQCPTGKRLLIEWMGGKDFYPVRYEVWGAIRGYAKQFNCRWIAATNRRRSLTKFYKSLDIKLDTCFMHDIMEESNVGMAS